MEEGFYEGVVYRPPSEWNSLIIQSTIGCSYNKCTFCSMYKEKKFRIKTVDQVKNDLDIAKKFYGESKRIFLADGDAFIRKTGEQIEILSYIKNIMPECKRVTCYASPRSILEKSKEELVALRNAGLTMVYLGLESGSDKVLEKINKGVTSSEMVEASRCIKESGIKLSVTAIIGIGGKENYRSHAEETGKILSVMNPDYIGLLTLMIEEGTELKKEWKKGEFNLPSQVEILKETRIVLENLNSPGSVFRANHASNYLNLKGTLNEDKENLIKIINEAIEGEILLKKEQYRGL